MHRIQALLPLIGYSPIQLLPSISAAFCDSNNIHAAHAFFYRSTVSNFSIRILRLILHTFIDTSPAQDQYL
jgi:hypothetical protein